MRRRRRSKSTKLARAMAGLDPPPVIRPKPGRPTRDEALRWLQSRGVVDLYTRITRLGFGPEKLYRYEAEIVTKRWPLLNTDEALVIVEGALRSATIK